MDTRVYKLIPDSGDPIFAALSPADLPRRPPPDSENWWVWIVVLAAIVGGLAWFFRPRRASAPLKSPESTGP